MKPKTTKDTKNNLLTPQKYSKKNVKFTIDSTDDKITFYAQFGRFSNKNIWFRAFPC